MSKKARIIVGSLSVLLIVVIAAFFFFRYQVRKSFPQTTGVISLPGLEKPADVFRDGYGVPSIEALSEHDLMFALGFVHAQDRLWQMDVIRRVGAGRLSELFGSVTLPFDRMFRIIGIRRISEDIEKALEPASRNRLQWYADGVNACIEKQKGKYPVEFDLLGYSPEPWQPVHSIMIGRLMAWELNLSWYADLTYGALLERVGAEKVQDVLPPYPSMIPPLVPSGEWQKYAGLGSNFLAIAQAFHEFEGAPGVSGGSNAWVIAPSKSASGKVILANDTHLQLQVPSKWYEVQLRGPGYDVSGMSVPGIPGIVVGRNQRIAWGVTNLMADDADFYIERIDPKDTTKYLYEGEWLPITYQHEEIRVKSDSIVTVSIRSTRHGPIVTDISTFLRKAQYPFVASMRWTGTEISDQIEAFNKIDRASNWKEFVAGVRGFSGPGQNFVYGDIEGNIGYWCGVKLPDRGRQSSTLPLPGWDKSSEWKGFVPFDELPHRYNPPEGYVASANNRIVDDSYPYHISDLWEPPSRIVRLTEVLGKGGSFSVEDFERLQNDKFSHQAGEMMPYILRALNESPPVFSESDLVLEYLRNWNFIFTKDDIATTIFQQFFVMLLENIYKDEMGDEVFHDYVMLPNIPIRVTSKLIEEGNSSWFDDIRTDTVETRDGIIRKSMKEAVLALRERLGTEMKAWRWGEVHPVTLQHPFGLQKPLDRIFSVGPFPYGGGPTSLVSGEYSYNNPFAVTVGASFRWIVDFSKPDEPRALLPPGQSGHAMHSHYDDQTQLWLNGAYRIAHVHRSPDQLPRWDRLTLEPAR